MTESFVNDVTRLTIVNASFFIIAPIECYCDEFYQRSPNRAGISSQLDNNETGWGLDTVRRHNKWVWGEASVACETFFILLSKKNNHF